MTKYKVGDKVRIVSERPSSVAFNYDMCRYLGTVMTIGKVLGFNKPSYKVAGVSASGSYFCEAVSNIQDAVFQFISPKDLEPLWSTEKRAAQ